MGETPSFRVCCAFSVSLPFVFSLYFLVVPPFVFLGAIFLFLIVCIITSLSPVRSVRRSFRFRFSAPSWPKLSGAMAAKVLNKAEITAVLSLLSGNEVDPKSMQVPEILTEIRTIVKSRGGRPSDPVAAGGGATPSLGDRVQEKEDAQKVREELADPQDPEDPEEGGDGGRDSEGKEEEDGEEDEEESD